MGGETVNCNILERQQEDPLTIKTSYNLTLLKSEEQGYFFSKSLTVNVYHLLYEKSSFVEPNT